MNSEDWKKTKRKNGLLFERGGYSREERTVKSLSRCKEKFTKWREDKKMGGEQHSLYSVSTDGVFEISKRSQQKKLRLHSAENNGERRGAQSRFNRGLHRGNGALKDPYFT